MGAREEAIAVFLNTDKEARRALLVLDELDRRQLLDRAQIIKCGDISIQLGPPPFTPPTLTPEEEAKKDEKKVDPLPDPNVLMFGASEGT